MDTDFLATYIARIVTPAGGGSGIPISDTLVLTAKHVIEGYTASDITIEFPNLSSQSGEISEAEVEDISLIGPIVKRMEQDVVLDVALIRLKDSTLKTKLSGVELCRTSLGGNANWESRGYPSLGTKKLGETSTQVKGSTFSYARTDTCLHLLSEDIPTKPTDWQGLSGAPVICNSKLYGVIVSSPTKLKERLTAVPIPLLLEEVPLFRQIYDAEFLGLHKKENTFSRQERQLVDELANELEEIFQFDYFGDKVRKNLVKHITKSVEKKRYLNTLSEPELARELVLQFKAQSFLNALAESLQKFKHAELRDNQAIELTRLIGDVKTIASKRATLEITLDALSECELAIGQYDGFGILQALPIGVESYAELVVSRWMGKASEFKHVDGVMPQVLHNAETLSTFDSSQQSQEEIFLNALYKTIVKKKPAALIHNTAGETYLNKLTEAIVLSVLNIASCEEEADDKCTRKMVYQLVTDSKKVQAIKAASKLIQQLEVKLDGKLKLFDLSCGTKNDITEKEGVLLTALGRVVDL